MKLFLEWRWRDKQIEVTNNSFSRTIWCVKVYAALVLHEETEKQKPTYDEKLAVLSYVRDSICSSDSIGNEFGFSARARFKLAK